MDFGEILTRAWNIIWKHKILWLFGFLSGISGTGANVNFNINNRNFPILNNRSFENMPQWLQRLVDSMPGWLPIFLLLAFLVVLVIMMVLGTYGRIGLTRGAWLGDEGEAHLGLGALWGYGSRYFWRMILLTVILLVLALAIGMIVLLPTAGLVLLTMGVGLICLLPLLCVFTLGFSLIKVVFDMAATAIVNEDLGVVAGLSRAWQVFTSHLGEVTGMAVILGLMTTIIGFVLSLPMIIIMFPLLANFLAKGGGDFRGGILLSIGLFFLYLPVLWVAHAILAAYVGSAWTVTFRRLTGRPAQLTILN